MGHINPKQNTKVIGNIMLWSLIRLSATESIADKLRETIRVKNIFFFRG